VHQRSGQALVAMLEMHGLMQTPRSLPVSFAPQHAEPGDLVRARRRSGRGGGEHRAAIGLQALSGQFCLVPGVATGAVHADGDALGAGKLAAGLLVYEESVPGAGGRSSSKKLPQWKVGLAGGADDLVADALLDHAALQPEQHQILPVTQ
jgi:hypothetical protein